MNRLCQQFEARIGTATIGAAFIVSAIFLLVPNGTRIYAVMGDADVRGLAGLIMLVSGVSVCFGATYPCRMARHLGQFGCSMSSWWLVFVSMLLEVTPSLPIVLGTLGTGLFVIWVKDCFAGIEYRNAMKLGGALDGFRRARRY